MLTGPTKTMFEAGLEAELDWRLGYTSTTPWGPDGRNSRNGMRLKTVLSEVGPSRWAWHSIGTAASTPASQEALDSSDQDVSVLWGTVSKITGTGQMGE